MHHIYNLIFPWAAPGEYGYVTIVCTLVHTETRCHLYWDDRSLIEREWPLMALNNTLIWCMPCYINGHKGERIGSVTYQRYIYIYNKSNKVDWWAWPWGCRPCVMRLVIRDQVLVTEWDVPYVTTHHMGPHIIGSFLEMDVIINVSH